MSERFPCDSCQAARVSKNFLCFICRVALCGACQRALPVGFDPSRPRHEPWEHLGITPEAYHARSRQPLTTSREIAGETNWTVLLNRWGEPRCRQFEADWNLHVAIGTMRRTYSVNPLRAAEILRELGYMLKRRPEEKEIVEAHS